MSHDQLIRAWKDPAYRDELSEEEKAGLPSHPSGAIELGGPELGLVTGGGAATTERVLTMGCCDGLTSDPGWCSIICPRPVPDSATPCGSGCCNEPVLCAS